MDERTDRTKPLAGIAVTLLLGIMAPPANATINASGLWFTTLSTLSPPIVVSCTLGLTQTGSMLATSSPPCSVLSLQLAGTIDSTSGAFTMSGSDQSFCGSAVTLSGTVAPDGRAFTAVAQCGISTFPYPINVTGSRCGNGALDPGEVCDDGNQFDFDCCSASCDSVAPEGTPCGFSGPCTSATCNGSGSCQTVPIDGPCDDFNQCTTDDTCVDGFCRGEVVADGTSCDDFNQCTTGDACDDGFCFGATPVECGPCSQCDFFEGCVARPAFSCSSLGSGRSTLRLRDDPHDKKDVVAWQLAPETGIAIGELGDPRSDTSYQLCVFETEPFFGLSLLAGLEVPAGGSCGGKPCWIPKRNGYRYTDRSGASDGVRSVDLEAGDRKRAELSILAKGPSVGLAPLPAELPVLVQLQSSEGSCWEAAFREARLNGPLELRARIKGSPSGAFVD